MHITIIAKNGDRIETEAPDGTTFSSDQLRIMVGRVVRPDFKPLAPMVD